VSENIYTYEEVYQKSLEYFNKDELATKVFIDKYVLRNENDEFVENSPDMMLRRISREIARIEKNKFKTPMTEDEIFSYLDHFKKIIPQGSPLYGIGNKYQYVTLSSCYVIDSPFDSYSGIMLTDEEIVNVCKRRGGIGSDLSTLRPTGSRTTNAARSSTGVVSFAERYSNSIREVGQNNRRGALMLTLSIHHPDVMNFINAKSDLQKINGANVSIRLNDDFMNAVKKETTYIRKWPIDSDCPQYIEEADAIKTWNKIMYNAWKSAEPGLLFWDKIIRESPADCYDKLGFKTTATNPCCTGNTLVYVADGRGNVPIKQLAEEEKDIPVFCYDHKGNITIRTMRHPRITGYNEKIYKITLEDGYEIKTTGNHKIRLSNGSYKEVKKLNIKTPIQFMFTMKASLNDFFHDIEDKENTRWIINGSTLMDSEYNIIEKYNKETKKDEDIIIQNNKKYIKRHCEYCGTKYLIEYKNREISYCSEQCATKQIDNEQTKSKNLTTNIRENKQNILKIEECGYEDVYNGTVDDFHNFFIGGFKSKTKNNKNKYIYINNLQCGELPLCGYDSCRLLVLNLYGYVKNPFTKNSYFDFDDFYKDAQIAERFMDDFVDLELECINRILEKITNDPEPDYIKDREINLWNKMKDKCLKGRRTGLGLTGLGDTIAASGYTYGSHHSINFAEKICMTLRDGAYKSSVDMAKELGPFPIWDYELEKNNPFLNRLKETERGKEIYNEMRQYGRRNISLLTISPTGSISILAQTTSGIEPLYAMSHTRRKKISEGEKIEPDFVDVNGDKYITFNIFHPKLLEWSKITGEKDYNKSPYANACAYDIFWKDRVKLQATVQKYICHSISSTINLPSTATVEDIKNIYETAYELGCKGITVYRDGCRSGILNVTNNEDHITKTNAPKRPKYVNCDIYHTSVKGEVYFVIIGLLNDEPYEIFAGKNDDISKTLKNACITKQKRGVYALCSIDKKDILHEDISKYINQEEETVTRLISSNLRHGCDVSFIVHQLEKTTGDMMSFTKAVSRILKKYIPDNTEVKGENCPQCQGKLIREEGCLRCLSCGYSKC